MKCQPLEGISELFLPKTKKKKVKVPELFLPNSKNSSNTLSFLVKIYWGLTLKTFREEQFGYLFAVYNLQLLHITPNLLLCTNSSFPIFEALIVTKWFDFSSFLNCSEEILCKSLKILFLVQANFFLFCNFLPFLAPIWQFLAIFEVGIEPSCN